MIHIYWNTDPCIACVSHLHHIERGGEEGGGPQPEEGPRVAGVAGVGHGQGRGGGGVGQRPQGVAGVVGVAEVGVAEGEAALGVVLQKAPSEYDPNVRNHGEGPY